MSTAVTLFEKATAQTLPVERLRYFHMQMTFKSCISRNGTRHFLQWWLWQVLFFLPLVSVGQFHQKKSVEEASLWHKFQYDMGNVFKGMGHVYSRPFHWNGKDLTTFGSVAGGTFLLSLVDERAQDFFEGHADDVPQAIRDYGWYYGSPQNNYMLTGVVYLTGLFTKDEKLRRTGVLLISSASAAGLFQQAGKYAFGRARPRSGLEYDHFRPFSSDKDFHSFPSGHTVLAFTNAYAIAKQFRSPWIKAGIYTVGLVPAISRMWERAHWLSDIAFSIAVSIFTVEAVDKYLDKKYSEKYNSNQKKLNWDLRVSPNGIGMALTF